MSTYRTIGALGASLTLLIGCAGGDTATDDTDTSEQPSPTAAPTTLTATTETPTTEAPATTETPTTEAPATTETPTTEAPATTETPTTEAPTTTAEPVVDTTTPPTGADWTPIDLAAGQWIAFVSVRFGSGDIFAVDVDTGEERQLTALATDLYQPAWSPDGSKIAVQCPSPHEPIDPEGGMGPSDICVLDLATGIVANVTDDALADQDPQWSPDGSRLAFLSVPPDGPIIRIISDDDPEPRELASGAFPAWSADGSSISAVDMDGSIDVVDPTSGEPSVIVATGAGIARAVWAPSGDEIAFACENGEPGPDEFLAPTDICAVAPDGSSLRVVSDAKRIDSSPAWSPDGSTIAFTSTEHFSEQIEIFVVPTEGGAATRVAAGLSPTWSPDGRSLGFLPADGGIALVDLESGEVDQVVIDPTVGDLTWAPAPASLD